MRHLTLTPEEILSRSRTSDGGAAMRVAKWASKNLVRVVDDCPECGACPDEGDEHGRHCPNGLEE